MKRTVCADSSYIPPVGVTVLPLEAHPAIAEDALNGWSNTGGGRSRGGKSGESPSRRRNDFAQGQIDSDAPGRRVTGRQVGG